jgi:hypothetical protein
MAALSAQDERPLSKHSISIRPLSAEETDERSAALSEVLIDCEGSAPVSFMASLDHGRAEAFWWGVARGERTLLIAEDRAGSAVVGTGAGGARPVGEPAAPGRRVKMLATAEPVGGVWVQLPCEPPRTQLGQSAGPCSCSTPRRAMQSASTSAQAGHGSRWPRLRPNVRRVSARYHLLLQTLGLRRAGRLGLGLLPVLGLLAGAFSAASAVCNAQREEQPDGWGKGPPIRNLRPAGPLKVRCSFGGKAMIAKSLKKWRARRDSNS